MLYILIFQNIVHLFQLLSYIHFEEIVPKTPNQRISLREAAKIFFAQPDFENKVRVKKDLDLLEPAMDTERFGNVSMTYYRSIFDPEAETQFAAVTYDLGDGTVVLVFRGTDRTLVGWKEDFNMAFQDSIPAQREALKYLEEFALSSLQPIRLAGHSKGGNLAVYAAAKADPFIQQRIAEIYNLDGPGFSESMMTDPGYLAVVPRIRSYVPESSIVGILLEHAEAHTVIKSKQIGPMQHDPYTWEVLRNDFIHMEEMSEGSKFMDQATKAWLASMTPQERNTLVDGVYEILTTGGAVKTEDLIHPKQIGTYVKRMATDDAKRGQVGERISELAKTVAAIQKRK